MGIYFISGLTFRSCKSVFITGVILLTCNGLVPGQPNDLKSSQAAEQVLASRGEVILRFVKPAGITLTEITRHLSIDHVSHDTITAYANRAGFDYFQSLHIPYEIIPAPSLQRHIFETRKISDDDWHTRYPTYAEYTGLMNSFLSDYPELCRLEEFGTSIDGHRLLALKISDSPELREIEPVVFLTSTMHGDEVLGYVLMLRLIEHLLSNYETDNFIRELVNNAEIWINPLSNPDGVYFLSDTSLEGATRFNKNNIDLNRDFPDIQNIDRDTLGREPETIAMMKFMEEILPTLAANFHSGAEVVNYPWDTYFTTHPDNQWYRGISRAYADTVHVYAPAGYMTFKENGITRGSLWYQIFGGRQDYTNYFLAGREVTIELSDTKIPPENSLDDYWNYNRQSLIQYINQSLTGLAGVITDSVTGKALQAKIRIPVHEPDNAGVFSRIADGAYFRLTPPGEFPIRVTSPGYKPKRIPVEVHKGELTRLNIELAPEPEQNIYPNPFRNELYLDVLNAGYYLQVTFIDLLGRKVKISRQPVYTAGRQNIPIDDLQPGSYIVVVTYNNKTWKMKAIKSY